MKRQAFSGSIIITTTITITIIISTTTALAHALPLPPPNNSSSSSAPPGRVAQPHASRHPQNPSPPPICPSASHSCAHHVTMMCECDASDMSQYHASVMQVPKHNVTHPNSSPRCGAPMPVRRRMLTRLRLRRLLPRDASARAVTLRLGAAADAEAVAEGCFEVTLRRRGD